MSLRCTTIFRGAPSVWSGIRANVGRTVLVLRAVDAGAAGSVLHGSEPLALFVKLLL
jgi:hypothetical protein